MELEAMLSPTSTQVELFPTLLNFLLCVFLAFIVRGVYIKRSFSMSGKMQIGSILPILAAVVFIVIVVVKSSLALSLGLVGALSIVRFRTPIKEPEELVYLFLAIAIGLGCAAGQALVTGVLALLTLLITYFWLSNKSIGQVNEYTLVVKWMSKDTTFDDIFNQLTPVVDSLRLVRLDKNSSGNTSVMSISPKPNQSIELLSSKVTELDDSAQVTFFEAKTNW